MSDLELLKIYLQGLGKNKLFAVVECNPIEFRITDVLNEIDNLQNQLQQKENIIKELNDKIEDDKMIIEGNWGCIDNLKKDYNLQKNILKEVREYITYWHYRNDFRINSFTTGVKEDLLGILDKENNNE